MSRRLAPSADGADLRGAVSGLLLVEMGLAGLVAVGLAMLAESRLGWSAAVAAVFVPLLLAPPLGTLFAWHWSFSDARSAWDGRHGHYVETLLAGGRSRDRLDTSARRWTVAATGALLGLWLFLLVKA